MYLYASTSRGVTDSTVVDFSDQAGACSGDSACPGGAAGSCVNGSCKGTCKVDSDCGLDVPAGTCDVAGGGDCQPVGRTIFDYMEQRQLDWKVYSSGTPGWAVMLATWLQYRAGHQFTLADYLADAAAGTLPQVAFVDPTDSRQRGLRRRRRAPARHAAGRAELQRHRHQRADDEPQLVVVRALPHLRRARRLLGPRPAPRRLRAGRDRSPSSRRAIRRARSTSTACACR